MFLRVQMEIGSPFLRVHPSHVKVSPFSGQRQHLLPNSFKSLSIGGAPEIEPATFYSAPASALPTDWLKKCEERFVYHVPTGTVTLAMDLPHSPPSPPHHKKTLTVVFFFSTLKKESKKLSGPKNSLNFKADPIARTNRRH